MNNRNLKKQAGATLVEAMVALVVFAIGALGIAALQTTTLVRSDDVKQRSLAIWKAQEFADRVRASVSIADVDGLVSEYIDRINVRNRNAIGKYDASGGFSCPAATPKRCDDTAGAGAGLCTTAELTAFDVWSVFCDPLTGASSNAIGNEDGINKLKNLDIAFFQVAGGDYLLYMEWQSRSTAQNEDLRSAAGVEVDTDLCGETVAVDTEVNVYCLRFR